MAGEQKALCIEALWKHFNAPVLHFEHASGYEHALSGSVFVQDSTFVGTSRLLK
jgi:hypothetical protein